MPLQRPLENRDHVRLRCGEDEIDAIVDVATPKRPEILWFMFSGTFLDFFCGMPATIDKHGVVRDQLKRRVIEVEVVSARTPEDDDVWIGPPIGEERCDFCSGPSPTWSYPATTTEQVAIDEDGDTVELMRQVGNWLACVACSRAIERGDREALLIRARDAVPEEIRDERALDIMRQLHRAFFEARTGPRVRHVRALA